MEEDTLLITLKKPITSAGVEYTTLTLREPTAGEYADALKKGSGPEADIAIISAVGAMPAAAVRLLTMRDFNQAATFIAGFMTPVPGTGASA